MLRFLTAGESHGQALGGILEGFPKGVRISREFINRELERRQSGFGRGERMRIEKDKVEILSGLRAGLSLGSPISFLIKNKDKTIAPFLKDNLKSLTIPRPSHADLAGALKYQEKDIRNILERASARETAVRVVIGALCKQFLKEFKIEILSHVVGVGGINIGRKAVTIKEVKEKTRKSLLNCIDRNKENLMIKKIEEAKKAKDTLGGVIEIISENIPVGLGSFMHWDKRLDAKIAYALMSIPAVKAVEIGLGFEYAKKVGSSSHDAIYYSQRKGFFYKTNNSGGIVGGVSTGQPIVARIAMKPIATLGKPLDSVDLVSKKAKKAPAIRSDIIALVACGVIAESMLAFVITQSFLEKFSSDNLAEIKRNYNSYLKSIKS